MSSKFFLGLNGPPGSGKDTLALALYNSQEVRNYFNIYHMKFAEPLKAATHMLFGGKYTEEGKSQASPYGPTWRELYIGMSELYAKVLVGPDVFGKIMVDSVKTEEAQWFPSALPRLYLCSDCGFLDEQLPVIEHFGAVNYSLVHLIRDKATFDGDSRSLIYPIGVPMHAFDNNLPKAEAEKAFVEKMMKGFKDMGWVK